MCAYYYYYYYYLLRLFYQVKPPFLFTYIIIIMIIVTINIIIELFSKHSRLNPLILLCLCTSYNYAASVFVY
jgi:hypothetical protein